MQKNTPLVSLALATTAVSLFGFGCNPFQSLQEKVEQKVSEKATEAAVGALTGGKVSMDTNKDNLVFKDNKTGSSVSIGENVAIPENFPKAVPIYAGAIAKSVSMSQAGDKESAVTLRTDDEPSKVATWYTETLVKAGWKEESSASMGPTETRLYKKDKEEISLLAFPVDEQSKGTLVTLVYKPGKTGATVDGDEGMIDE